MFFLHKKHETERYVTHITINVRAVKSIWRLSHRRVHTSGNRPIGSRRTSHRSFLLASSPRDCPAVNINFQSLWQRSRNPAEGDYSGRSFRRIKPCGGFEMYPGVDWGIRALLLTDICLFVVLDEFSELKVSSNNRHLERETDEEETQFFTRGVWEEITHEITFY